MNAKVAEDLVQDFDWKIIQGHACSVRSGVWLGEAEKGFVLASSGGNSAELPAHL
jgi:hypothetical protein